MKKLFAACLLLSSQTLVAMAQSQTFSAQVMGGSKALHPHQQTIEVLVSGAEASKPLSAHLNMPSMASMMLNEPKVSAGSMPGSYRISLNFPHAGSYVLTLVSGEHKAEISLTVEDGDMAKSDHMTMQMKGRLGAWNMNREGSGTAWQPDASPMFMKMLPSRNGMELSAMGSMVGGYVNSGGSRGSKEFFTDSMFMLMGRKEASGGVFGLDLMASLDPIINGVKGVPDLFQTGETAHSQPLVDRQHPHNLYAEAAASYSKALAPNWSGFLYGGPIGEPALGNVMFMHRPSDMEVPEAPISHHWFDSTHISFGVITAGAVYQNKWKLEASAFNGHEPGENRYIFGPIALNSSSARVAYNPNANWSYSASYGYLNSPEELSPGANERRVTASAAYSRDLANGDNLSIGAYWGQKNIRSAGERSNAYELEATLLKGANSYFARFERVDEDELRQVPAGNYKVSKLLFGTVRGIGSKDGVDYGLGLYAGVYDFPSALQPYYGKHPMTLGVYLRARFSRM